MDDFVCTKLTEWGLSNWIERFKDQGIDKESLLLLEVKDIDNLITKTGPRAKFRSCLRLLKKELETACSEAEDVSNCPQEHQNAVDCAQAVPSTSACSDEGNRPLDVAMQPTPKRRKTDYVGPCSEEIILPKVKNIMRNVYGKLHLDENTKLNSFLKTKIGDLENNKRELVGVFGRTGAGKSSLINAIIGEFNLLPSGDVSACTSVMIKVEANMNKTKYEAEIEFIPKEEWKDELWPLRNIPENNQEKEDYDGYDDYDDIVMKLSAVYGEEWNSISPDSRMDPKHFREIPEFLNNTKKILTCETAEELSAKFGKYTRSESSEGVVKRWYWPLVKCVTVRVPNNPLLKHVTLVDLPGNGDRNKSRDKMWKEFVGCCSTVWIVADVNRAASEIEAWDILESTYSLIGNGGQCQQIHFICTKTDQSDKWDELPADAVRERILRRNMEAKKEVQKEFNKLKDVKKHFTDECFEVFTVSAKQFRKGKRNERKTILRPDETDIPKLQEFLQNLNDCHSETLNYVSGAYGILSLMQGARSRDTADSKTMVCLQLEEKLQNQLQKIRKTMEETSEAFGRCLTEGVQNSASSCEATLRAFLNPKQKGRGFHRTLKCIVKNNGVHKPKKGKPINLNAKLSSVLTGSIDEMFRKTFPNESTRAPFNEVISAFSLDTEGLTEKYKAVELQLIFLKTEEEKIKKKIVQTIRDRKKAIYSSLTETIEDNMQCAYKKAASFTGQDTLKNMRDTLEEHVCDSKNIMFELAKSFMLQHLQKLKEEILETLETTLNKSIELSLKTDEHFIPDFSKELDRVNQYYTQLKASRN